MARADLTLPEDEPLLKWREAIDAAIAHYGPDAICTNESGYGVCVVEYESEEELLAEQARLNQRLFQIVEKLQRYPCTTSAPATAPCVPPASANS